MTPDKDSDVDFTTDSTTAAAEEAVIQYFMDPRVNQIAHDYVYGN